MVIYKNVFGEGVYYRGKFDILTKILFLHIITIVIIMNCKNRMANICHRSGIHSIKESKQENNKLKQTGLIGSSSRDASSDDIM